MLSDFRFALRRLRRSPGFALTAILTLALGIGPNAAIFTLLDSIMLRPLPFPQPDRLIRIGYGAGHSIAAPVPKGWVHALGQAGSFTSVSGFGADAESNVGEANAADRVFGAEVLANALDTLAIHPAVGQFFTPDDGVAGHDPTVVLSYGYWRQHFAESPTVVGTTLRIDGTPRRVIGVMPAGVHFPYADTQFVIPVTFRGGDPVDPWNNFDLHPFGRLKAGVTPAQAQSELRHLQKLLLPQFPWIMPSSWAADMTVVPLLEAEVGAIRPRLLLLFCAVGLILLIACANVANLMLARAKGREREIALRGALGASGPRIVRQLLAESVILGAAAGAVGLLAAATSLRALVTLLPADTPRVEDVALHWPVFLFTAIAAVLTGVLFGLIPALQVSSPNLRDALHSGSRNASGNAGQFRASMLLVVGQIGLSVAVITAAGLMLHSLWSLSQVNPGFGTERIVTAEVSMDASACPDHHLTPHGAPAGRCQAFFQTLVEHLRGVTGEEEVGLAGALPLSGLYGSYAYDVQDRPRDPRQEPLLATQRIVSPGYFSTLGMKLVRGRLLDEQDASGTSRAVVISQHMANELWPRQNPVGQHLLNVVDEPVPAQWVSNAASVVVGVVSNTLDESLAAGFGDQVYLPMTPASERPVMYVLLRTRVPTMEAAAQLRQTVAAIDPQVPVTRVLSLNEVVAASESAPRSLTLLLVVFGGLAVIIGGVGVYSLIAYIVNWRLREFGIRLALGAQRWEIVRGVVRQSLMLALGGCGVGLIAAALLARLMRGFLFGVGVVDPLTFCSVPLLMAVLAIVAAWAPARRAARVDPIKMLRME